MKPASHSTHLPAPATAQGRRLNHFQIFFPVISLTCLMQGPVIAAQTEVSPALQSRYGQLPLSFEANRGQTDPSVNFLSYGPGYSLFLTPTEAVMVLKKTQADANTPVTQPDPSKGSEAVLRMQLMNANPGAGAKGQAPLPGRVNYLKGKYPGHWRTHIPTYAKVSYHGVYPGVDLVYYGNQRLLEYDFVVAPGASPEAIRLKFDGASGLRVDKHGDLVLAMGAGAAIVQQTPKVYQQINGSRKAVSGHYVVLAKDQVGFQIAAYDSARPLVIDPVLVYSTYLGAAIVMAEVLLPWTVKAMPM
jgi:hypothetical protein